MNMYSNHYQLLPLAVHITLGLVTSTTAPPLYAGPATLARDLVVSLAMITNQDWSLRVVLRVGSLHLPYHSPLALDPMATNILAELAIGMAQLGVDVSVVLGQAFEAFQASLEARR